MPAPTPSDWRTVLIAHAALESGLLDAFARPRSPEDAAAAAGLDPRACRIVATALVDSGHLRRDDDGRLEVTDAAAALLSPGRGPDPAAALHLEARAIASHLRLSEALRSGAPRDDVSGGDRSTRERFMRAMRDIASARADESAAALGPPSGGGRLLDVGGAPGTYAIRFAAEGWRVTVLDLPGTLELGEADLRAAGVAAVAGDATEALPDGPWDAVYLGNVVHLLAPAEAAALVARAGAALAPSGLLAIQEVLGDASPQGPTFGVMMLLSTPGGDAYPADRYRDWMAAAGCPLERVVPIAEGWHHLMLGRRTTA